MEEKDITKDDFPFTKAREEELRAKISKEDALKIFYDEMEFNKEIQIFVLNQMKKRKLTPNYIVGTLYKLAWSILNQDFIEQIEFMEKYSKGGR